MRWQWATIPLCKQSRLSCLLFNHSACLSVYIFLYKKNETITTTGNKTNHKRNQKRHVWRASVDYRVIHLNCKKVLSCCYKMIQKMKVSLGSKLMKVLVINQGNTPRCSQLPQFICCTFGENWLSRQKPDSTR